MGSADISCPSDHLKEGRLRGRPAFSRATRMIRSTIQAGRELARARFGYHAFAASYVILRSLFVKKNPTRAPFERPSQQSRKAVHAPLLTQRWSAMLC
jgi:hypothetical protein